MSTAMTIVWWVFAVAIVVAIVLAVRDTRRYQAGREASRALEHARASNYRDRLPL